MIENKAVSEGTNENQNQTRQLAIRFAPEIVFRLETEAAAKNVSPTEIVRSIVCEHYAEAGDPKELIRQVSELIEDRFRHIVYEISRTRASLYHIAEQSPGLQISTDMLRKIFEVTREDARKYLEKLEAEMKRRQSTPEENARGPQG